MIDYCIIIMASFNEFLQNNIVCNTICRATVFLHHLKMLFSFKESLYPTNVVSYTTKSTASPSPKQMKPAFQLHYSNFKLVKNLQLVSQKTVEKAQHPYATVSNINVKH